MKNILIIVFVISGFFGLYNKVSAQAPGTLDPGFANGGELGDSVLIPPFIYSGLALSAGNGFVVSNADGTGDTIQVTRYTADGVRDSAFGLNDSGYVRIVKPGFAGIITTSLVQPDQKILIAGQYAQSGANQKGYILRLNADGTVDNTFGTGGWCFFNFFPAHGEFIRQMAIQGNGSIVALDIENYPGVTDTFVVARITSTGIFDNTFATNGAYTVPFYNFLATSPSAFTLDANNNFTCAAYSNYRSSDYFYLFRLTDAGVADASYGNNGSILIDSTNIINGGSDLGLNFESDGKLITVQTRQTGSLLWAVCRYNTDGSRDATFGDSGLVAVQPNLFPVPYSVANITSTASGQIITAGIVSVAGANRLIINSFNADGSVDASFGNNQGSELLNGFQLDDILYNVLIQEDNKILVNGLINETDYQQFEVARFLGTSGSTAIKQLHNGPAFSVYPNPALQQICLQFSAEVAGNISIRDITGSLIMVKESNGMAVQTLDISKLAPGVYTVTWQSNQNLVSEMMVKQ